MKDNTSYHSYSTRDEHSELNNFSNLYESSLGNSEFDQIKYDKEKDHLPPIDELYQ